MLAPWEKSYDQPRQHVKKQRHYFADKGLSSQSYGFSSSHVWMWDLDQKESWVSKSFLLDHKGNQSWIFIGRTDAETEALIFWPPDANSWLIRKDPDTRKDWRQEEKRTTEDEIARLHHWLNRHEFQQVLGDGERQRSLACCSPWGHKKSDMTEWLNNR